MLVHVFTVYCNCIVSDNVLVDLLFKYTLIIVVLLLYIGGTNIKIINCLILKTLCSQVMRQYNVTLTVGKTTIESMILV